MCGEESGQRPGLGHGGMSWTPASLTTRTGEIKICLEQIPTTMSGQFPIQERNERPGGQCWPECVQCVTSAEIKSRSLMRQQSHYYRPRPRPALHIISLSRTKKRSLCLKEKSILMCKMVQVLVAFSPLVSFLFSCICCIAFCCDLIV